MGKYLGDLAISYGLNKTIRDQKKLYNTEKNLGSPWYKKALVGVADFVAGASPTSLLWNPMDWYERNRQGHLNDLQAKARNSSGVGGEAELKKAANSTRAIMNQQLQSNIDTINTAYGTAGRYGGGANKQAVLQAQNSTNFNLANVVNQMSLQESQFQRNLEEERAWRQASLDAGQPGMADKIGDIANLGIQLYASNPDYFNQKIGGLGEKMGIGGVQDNTYAAPPKQFSLPNISRMTVNPQDQPYGPNLAPMVYDNGQLTGIPRAATKSLLVPDFMKVPVAKHDTGTGQTYIDYVNMQPAQKEVIKQQVLSTPPDIMIEDSNLAPKLSVALEMAKTEDIRRLIAKYNGTPDWEGFFQELQSIMGGGTNGGNSVSNTK